MPNFGIAFPESIRFLPFIPVFQGFPVQCRPHRKAYSQRLPRLGRKEELIPSYCFAVNFSTQEADGMSHISTRRFSSRP